MSTAYSSAKQKYIGNGVTTEWGFDFPIQKHSELKVYLKRSSLPQVLLEEGVDYSFVTENTIAFPIKTGEAKLQATDVLALQRESVFESEYNFSNQQRLEPEEVMHADDNLERQIQELKRDSESAIKVQPTSNINTDEYFIAVESIYENLDNITNVSGISAEIVNCSDNISDISTVSSDIANVNAVGQSISNVNTVANNISDVNTAALNIEAIKDAPNQANAASQSASAASQSASDASQYATNAANSATDSANSATASATSAQAAQNALNDVHGLIATPIGTVFQSVYVDESLDIARQLNGQLISSTKFTGFRSWLNTVQTANPSLFTTETNWQAEKTNSKLGQCGKFVIDDTAGTIRLPCVVNAQGLVDLALIGGIKSESLPNITGSVNNIYIGSVSQTWIGSLSSEYGSAGDRGPGSSISSTIKFDASHSSSTYQDNAPVQQEAVQYPYYIQVATGVEETLPAIREYNINTPFFFGQSMYSDVAPDNASWLASNGQYNAKTVYPDYYDWLLTQYNNPTESNVVKVGSVTDNNGVLGGFSSANNALLPVTFSPANNPWEIVIKFKTPQTFSEQGLISKTHKNGMNYGLRIGFTSNGGVYYLIGSSYNTFICDGMGVQILSVDTNYYVKFVFTGEAYKSYISTDGETWTEDFSFSTTTPIESFDEPTYLGDNKYKNIPFAGSVDLNESYININGQRWWNGRKSKVIKIGETSISSDYDFVVNQNDQTFRLPLLNGEEDLPGNTFENITYNGHGSTYTAPKNGSYTIWGYGSTAFLFLNNNTSGERITTQGKTSSSESCGCTIKVKKGDVVIAGYYGGTVTYFGFTPAIGNGTLYYYVGDTVQDASLINAGAVLGQLSDKISRTAASDREMVVGWGMPDYSKTVSVTAFPYKAPYDGVFFSAGYYTDNQTGLFKIGGVMVGRYGGNKINLDANWFLVSKGSVITNEGTAANGCGFAPLKGVV